MKHRLQEAQQGNTGLGDTGRGQAPSLHFGDSADAPIELFQGLPLLSEDDLDDLDDAPDAELEETEGTRG